MENDNHFSTSDLGLASFLLASGLPLVGLQWQDEVRAEFLFRNPEKAEALTAAYWSGDGEISGLRFKVALDELKRRLWRERGRSR